MSLIWVLCALGAARHYTFQPFDFALDPALWLTVAACFTHDWSKINGYYVE
jgi:hypothetical protein